jgi:hypothetical protein
LWADEGAALNVQGFSIHCLTKAPPLIVTTVHGMGSGSALRLSGMTKVREIK